MTSFLVVHPGPHFSVADVYTGWCEGLVECGAAVRRFNLGDQVTFFDAALVPTGEEGVFRKALDSTEILIQAHERLCAWLYRMQPDVLLVVSGFMVRTDLLDLARSRGTKVVLLHTESPYEEDRQLELSAHADVTILNDPVNLGRYPGKVFYAPHAYRPSVHQPGPSDLDLVCDLAFVGTGYPSRVAFFEAMKLDDLAVTLAGNWQILTEDSPLRPFVPHDLNECTDNAEAVRLYQSARVGLNLYRREASASETSDGVAMGPREVEMAACGLFFLRDPRPEGDEVLHMLPTFDSPEDASEQLRWWLKHPAQREKAAQQALEAVADRTFRNNAAQLLAALNF